MVHSPVGQTPRSGGPLSRELRVPPLPAPTADRRTLYLCAVLVVAILAAYANHFQNPFEFDDSHTITDNPAVRTLHNLPRFFTDTSLFSSMKGSQVYRPMVSASVAIDYWLAGGYHPFFFHLSTFLWYSVELVLMFLLFRQLMDAADPHPSNIWTALFAAACYALHPANAETINYVIQRADIYNTVGVVASLYLFAAVPKARRQGWYLIPAVAGILSKPPALIFPFILLAYVFLVEKQGSFGGGEQSGRKWIESLRASLPAFLATAAAAILTVAMTPSDYRPGSNAPGLYFVTQPWVMLHYFKAFFLPTNLNVDAGWNPVSPGSIQAIAGFLFIAALLAVAVRASRQPRTRIIAFGILWFFLALLPTSLTPLNDVMNDHRMFFAFVGLALAVPWSARLLASNTFLARHARPIAGLALVILTVEAVGAHTRNSVWHSSEALWRDSTFKNPQNGRAWMGYGYAVFARGDYEAAATYFERGAALLPFDADLEIALGHAYGALGRDADAARHYERGISLAPSLWRTYGYYGRWLKDKGRLAESQAQLEAAVRLDREAITPREILMEVYAKQLNWPALGSLARETLALDSTNEAARRYLVVVQQISAMETLRPAQAPAVRPDQLAPAGAAGQGIKQKARNETPRK